MNRAINLVVKHILFSLSSFVSPELFKEYIISIVVAQCWEVNQSCVGICMSTSHSINQTTYHFEQMVIEIRILLSCVLWIVISQLLLISSDILLGNPYVVMRVSAAESKAKPPIVCTGDFHFLAWRFICGIDALDMKFPPPDVFCDIINGSLTIEAYEPKFDSFIPNSMRSVKTITGKLELIRVAGYPSFLNTINQIGHFKSSYLNEYRNP